MMIKFQFRKCWIILISIFSLLFIFHQIEPIDAQRQKKYAQEVKKRTNSKETNEKKSSSKEKKTDSFFDEFLQQEKEKGSRILPENEKSIKVEVDGSTQTIVDEPTCPTCPVAQLQGKYALQHYWMQKLEISYACACQVMTSAAGPDEVMKALFTSLKSQRHYIPQFNTGISIPTMADPKPILKDWEILGPFPIGKMELDGDPTFQSPKFNEYQDFASYLLSMSSNALRYSELVTEGKVNWKKLQSGSGGQTDVHFTVSWQELGQGLSTNAAYEYQAWARMTTYVKSSGSFILDCQGPHSVYVRHDNATRFLVADVYKGQQIKASLDLKPGLVGVLVPIRAVVQAQFACSLYPANNQIIVYPPMMVPQVVELDSNQGKGLLLSNVFALTIHNTFSQTISVEFSLESPVGEDVNFFVRQARGLNEESSVFSVYNIAAGQTMSLPLEMIISAQTKNKKTASISPPEVFIGCRENRIFQLHVNPSKGNSVKVPLDLSCRKQDQSFLYSFIDHDGSVAQAAVILPLNFHTPNYKFLGKRSPQKKDVEPKGSVEYPVLLTMHGSGIQPLNHADAHKMMPLNSKKYLFGIENYYIVAPSRFGAHNWEGVGDLSARQSIFSLQRSLLMTNGLLPNLTLDSSMVAGHSMGGHGAWITAMNAPNLFQCVLPLAGWIKKEEYATSNLFFALDISNSFINPHLKSVFERSLSEYHVDHFVSNLQTSFTYLRVGTHDFTTYPWFTRRMYRLLKHANLNVTIEEVFGKQHWWWDTLKENDGGVVNDAKMREFYQFCYDQHRGQKLLDSHYQNYVQRQASANDEERYFSFDDFLDEVSSAADKRSNAEKDVTSEVIPTHRCEKNITLNVINPSVHAGYCGLQIIHQRQSLMISSVSVSCVKTVTDTGRPGKVCKIKTANILRFSISFAFGTALFEATQVFINDQKLGQLNGGKPYHICLGDGEPISQCSATLHPLSEKSLLSYGPIRKVYDRPFAIVYGTPTDQVLRITLKDFALYLANSHYTSHYTSVHVLSDLEYTTGNYLKRTVFQNIIFIGDHITNKVVKSILQITTKDGKAKGNEGSNYVLRGRLSEDIQLFGYGADSEDESHKKARRGFRLKDSHFDQADHAIIFTLPLLRESNLFPSEDNPTELDSGNSAMGVIIHANTVHGYHHLSRLAWPVIPPMVRAPFANYLPDYVVVDHHIWDEGFGGILAAGFWNMNWRYDATQGYIDPRYL